MSFHKGVFQGKEVVICKSGVGKLMLQLQLNCLLITFQFSCYIHGCCRCNRSKLNIVDIVISTSAMQHDLDATALGFKGASMFDYPSRFYSGF
ncbi:hypothetical protein KHA80_16035 [Anaerobacillus sp. HL2]|nr:hypothetical protein KHA80_16035 [Anaerobacillus sp. HL2]